MLGYGPHPSFGQAGERQYVGRTVAEFGEEPHESFSRLIGSDHQSSGRPGQRVLRDHSLARFDVAQMKVFASLLDQILSLHKDRVEHGVCGWLDIHGDDTVRADDSEGLLRVCLVGLDTIGQSDCNELGIVSIGSKVRNRGLREKASSKRVDAAAYSENEGSA